MYNYGDHEINYQRRCPQWDGFFSFSCHKIALFEKKYEIKLMTLISMYHLKLLVSLDRFIKSTDTAQTLCIATLHRIIL